MPGTRSNSSRSARLTSTGVSRSGMSRTFGKARPGNIFAVWQGNAVPSGATVRNMLPQPFTHFLALPSW